MLSKYFKKFFKQEERKIEKLEDIVYQMYKDKINIEIIMVEMGLKKMDIIAIVQTKKKEARGE